MNNPAASLRIRVILESHFRKGGASLLVCLDARQDVASFSEMTFENRYNLSAAGGTAIYNSLKVSKFKSV